MKIKLLLLPAALVLGLSGCIKEPSARPQQNGGTVDLSGFDLSRTMTVTPPAGYVAVVSDAEGNVVCRTGVALSFPVDKARSYSTAYEPQPRSAAAPSEWFAAYEQTLCFEDSDDCDNDYNDLVVYVRQRVEVDQTKPAGHQNVYYLDITPIAAGAANRNGFGFETSAGVTHLVTDNYARDFFCNDVFDPARMGSSAWAPVNCAQWLIAKEAPKPYQTITVGGYDLGDNPRINFFVKTSTGEKHYITTDPSWPASMEHAAVSNGRPYGLAIPGKFAYPGETISIFEAYPDFQAWLDGSKPTFLNGNERIDKLYQSLLGLSGLYRFTNGGLWGDTVIDISDPYFLAFCLGEYTYDRGYYNDPYNYVNQYCGSYDGPREGGNGDGKIQYREIRNVTSIDMKAFLCAFIHSQTDPFRINGNRVVNLTGIKYFTSLKTFQTHEEPGLGDMDFSGLTKLETISVYAYFDCVRSIDVTGCTALKNLGLDVDQNGGHLSGTVDLTTNSALQSVSITGHPDLQYIKVPRGYTFSITKDPHVEIIY